MKFLGVEVSDEEIIEIKEKVKAIKDEDLISKYLELRDKTEWDMLSNRIFALKILERREFQDQMKERGLL